MKILKIIFVTIMMTLLTTSCANVEHEFLIRTDSKHATKLLADNEFQNDRQTKRILTDKLIQAHKAENLKTQFTFIGETHINN